MWTIKIHRLVIEADFKNIDRAARKKILKSINKKLSDAPLSHGEPMRGELKAYRKLRVGDYRAIYRTVRDQLLVLVIKAGIRRDEQVYRELLMRVKKL